MVPTRIPLAHTSTTTTLRRNHRYNYPPRNDCYADRTQMGLPELAYRLYHTTAAATAAATVGATLSGPGMFLPSVGSGIVGGVVGGPGATIEYLRDLVQKRITALTYTRNVHDGCVVYVYHLFVT